MFRLSQMRIAGRIGVGFAAVSIILLVLGASAIYSMRSVKDKASELVDIYVPQMRLSNNSVDTASQMISNAIQYSLSRSTAKLQFSKELIGEAVKALNDWEVAANQTAKLSYLSRDIEAAKKASSDMEKALDTLAVEINKLGRIYKEMVAISRALMQLSDQYLESQSDDLKIAVELKDSSDATIYNIEKTSWITDVAQKINEIRIGFLEGQVAEDFSEFSAVEMPKFSVVSEKLGLLRSVTKKSDNIGRLDEIEKNTVNYKAMITEYLDTFRNIVALRKSVSDAGETTLMTFRNSSESTLSQTTTIAQDSASQLDRAGWQLGLGVALAIILSVVISLFSTWSITKPIKVITKALGTNSQELATATEQLSTASQKTSESAAQSAVSLEETVTSMEQFSSMIQRNAQNAKEVNTLAQLSKRTAESGNSEIQALIAAMKDITTSSKKIEEIIGVIDDIAFQTNLLALNAAVEAARAGEHGKGFAVVAEAVRNLAQSSASAAKEISGIIKQSVESSNNGAIIADKSGESLREILQSSKKVADLIGEIVSASEEQARSVDMISKTVNQIDQATQGNSATAEETAATSEEIASQTQCLDRAVKDLVDMVEGANRRLNNRAPLRLVSPGAGAEPDHIDANHLQKEA